MNLSRGAIEAMYAAAELPLPDPPEQAGYTVNSLLKMQSQTAPMILGGGSKLPHAVRDWLVGRLMGFVVHQSVEDLSGLVMGLDYMPLTWERERARGWEVSHAVHQPPAVVGYILRSDQPSPDAAYEVTRHELQMVRSRCGDVMVEWGVAVCLCSPLPRLILSPVREWMA